MTGTNGGKPGAVLIDTHCDVCGGAVPGPGQGGTFCAMCGALLRNDAAGITPRLVFADAALRDAPIHVAAFVAVLALHKAAERSGGIFSVGRTWPEVAAMLGTISRVDAVERFKRGSNTEEG